MRRLAILAVVVGVVSAAIAARWAPRTGAEDATPTIGASPAVGTPVAAASRIGDVLHTADGAWDITVTGVEVRRTLLGKTAQGNFVLVTFDITNTSDLADVFPMNAIKLVDAQGRTHDEDGLTSSFNTSAPRYFAYNGPIAPGKVQEAGVVFDVPEGTTGLMLEFTPWSFNVDLGR